MVAIATIFNDTGSIALSQYINFFIKVLKQTSLPCLTKYFTERQTSSGRVALCLCTVWQPVSEPHSTLGWTSGIDCQMEHKHWSMQWVRWAHSAVDYLAAAVGRDRREGLDG